MAKGDCIKVLIDIGNGQVVDRVFLASKAGQTVEFDRDKKTGDYEVIVRGRAGTPARTVNLRGDRVLLIEEVPA